MTDTMPEGMAAELAAEQADPVIRADQADGPAMTVEQTEQVVAALHREREGYVMREAVARKQLERLEQLDPDDAAVRMRRTSLEVELDRVTARQQQVDDQLAAHGVKAGPGKGKARTAARPQTGKQTR